jgi:membrane AbrB-like protein
MWAALCGAGAQELNVPLPWLLGPMFGIAFLSFAGMTERQPASARRLGQLVIGLTLGLYFTSAVISEISRLAGWMVLAAFFCLGLSALFARFLQQFSNVSGYTALYASAIGAAGDMAIQAQRMGADGAAVATSHAVRVMIVVTAIPFAADFYSDTALRPLASLTSQFPVIGWPELGAIGVIGAGLAWVLNRWRLPNPWLLAPMVVAALYAATGNETRMPDFIVAGGSVLIGWSVGQYMTRDFFTSAPKVVAGAALMTIGMLLLSFLFAYALSEWIGIALITAIVSTSPGGIAEMAITAKILGLGAPLVTAFHFLRLISVILLTKALGQKLIMLGWLKE